MRSTDSTDAERSVDAASQVARVIEFAQAGIEMRERVVVTAHAVPRTPHSPVADGFRRGANFNTGATPSLEVHPWIEVHGPQIATPRLLDVTEQQSGSENEKCRERGGQIGN